MIRRFGRAAPIALGSLAILQALLMVAPMPTYWLWLAHMGALETSLAACLLAALSLVLSMARSADTRSARPLLAFRLAVLAAGLLAAVPLVAAWPLYRAHGLSFSWRDYVLVRRPPPPSRVDVALDPARPDLAVDVYEGHGSGRHPFVVTIHGGSWRGGDKGAGRILSWALAGRGVTVFDVRYRLAPAHPFPAAVGDVKCLLGRIEEQAASLNVDPSRGALLGRSAGGNVALVAAWSAGDPALPPSCAVADSMVRPVVSLYAPTDLVRGHDHPARPDVVQGPEAVELYLGGLPAERPETYRLASPIHWAARAGPVLVIHGSADRLVLPEHVEILKAALEGAGRTGRWLLVPWADHGFDLRPGGVGEQLARRAIEDFIDQTLKPSRP